jgi:putative transposase
MQKFYETFGHAKTRIRYHIIFSTKYRRKCLNAIRDIVLESFRMAEQKSKLTIYEMELDNDHIHFLINIPPSISISDSVRLLKQYSTYYIYKNSFAAIHLRKF